MSITSIPLPQIKFGKRKERSQICEFFTPDGRWVDRENPVLNSCVDDEATGMAFLIDNDDQFLGEDGFFHQLYSEQSIEPIRLRDGRDVQSSNLETLKGDIYEVTFWQRVTDGIQAAKQTDLMNKLTTIIGIICGTGLILAGAHYFWG